MALSTLRHRATVTLALGGVCLLIALWDLSDQTFGASSRGALSGMISIWLFHTFGHWGPRLALIMIGVLFVALAFWLASLARRDEESSDTTSANARADQPSGTSIFGILSWTLVLLVFSLLAFVVVGPLLRNPTIDGVLSHWRERYYTPAATVPTMLVLGLCVRLQWAEFHETGDPWELVRMLMLLVFAIILLIFLLVLSWEAIFGTA